LISSVAGAASFLCGSGSGKKFLSGSGSCSYFIFYQAIFLKTNKVNPGIGAAFPQIFV
jgi:hypothetical protein